MKKSLITKIILVAASVLSLIFLALPFMPEASGFDFLQVLQIIGDAFGADFLVAIYYLAPLLILIASVVLIVFSILALLGELNVIKNEKLLNVSAKINFIVSIVLCVVAAVAFVLALIKSIGIGVGLILILVIAVAALVSTILEKKWSKE